MYSQYLSSDRKLLKSEHTKGFWSVMIPTYRPTEDHLRKSLESILSQDRGSELMQIEVVDDCSPDVDVETLVHRIGKGRITFTQTKRNLGLSGCWNICVERATGQWVHLLHQDDFVCDGFYSDLENLILECPDAGAAFTRHAISDQDGHWLTISPLEQTSPGPLVNWIERLAVWQRIRCPAIVVRRQCYSTLGGFRDDLPYVLDWEMWARLAKHCTIAYTPSVLAVHRTHANSESFRLKSLERAQDVIKGFDLIIADFQPKVKSEVERAFRVAFAESLKVDSRTLLQVGGGSELRHLILKYWYRLPNPHKVLFVYRFLQTLF
jgi:GT2 family glycosyltransferase